MLSLIACAAFLAVAADNPSPAADVTQSYQEAKSKVGRSSEDQVKLALWCESHGLTVQRLHHLTLAVLADPKNAMARGLMGLVSHDGRWLRPEAVAEKAKADPALAEYQDRRLKAPYTADAQFALGIWAEEHGLEEQAKAHLTAVIRLDPKRDAAWKKLGYRKHDGRWVTDAQLVAEKSEAEAQKAADRKWKPLLEKYRSMLDQPARRAEAEEALAEVTDPRAVPTIAQVFGRSTARQVMAVQLLGQIDSPSASRALAVLAVFGKSSEARRTAAETLKGRDLREFARLWIALIRKPIKYAFKPINGPGSSGTLVVEGEQAILRRIYATPSMPSIPYLPGATISYDANGLPVMQQRLDNTIGSRGIAGSNFAELQKEARTRGSEEISRLSTQANRFTKSELDVIENFARGFSDPILNVQNPQAYPDVAGVYRPINTNELDIPIGEMIAETQYSATVAQQHLASDVASLDRMNAAIRSSNEPILQALQGVTGMNLGEDGAAWNRWMTDLEGYAVMTSDNSSKPTIYEDVPIDYVPMAQPMIVHGPVVGYVRTHSCFGGGTPVRTIDGDRPIETIRAGDLVLVQDTRTGALGYQGVLTAFHNPPNATLKIRLGGSESVVATGIHRFWKVGKGWTMARDLKVGDQVRTLGGVATVEGVEADRVQPVFNLEVGEGHSFLVGKLGALVHDNSLVEPTPEPFDGGLKPAK